MSSVLVDIACIEDSCPNPREIYLRPLNFVFPTLVFPVFLVWELKGGLTSHADKVACTSALFDTFPAIFIISARLLSPLYLGNQDLRELES